MGDVADMMVEGILCAECGVALQHNGPDVPTLCHDCHSDYKKRCDQPERGMYCERFYGK